MQIRIMLRTPLDRGWLRFARSSSQASDHGTVIAVTRISHRLSRPARATIRSVQDTLAHARRAELAGRVG